MDMSDRAPGMNEASLLAAAKGGEKRSVDIEGVLECGL